MKTPLVAFTQRCDFTGPPHDEWRDAADVRLARFIMAGGGLPVPVPSALGDDPRAWLAAVAPDAIVLSGGSDIGTVPARDALERALLDHARADGLPVLGICRGMQMMAHAAGTRLVAARGHVATRHRLSGTLDHEVNSFHGIAPADVPQGYAALARAPDGTLEAIAHDTLPWEGWMWHPEREDRFDPADISRFRKVLT